MTTRAAPRPVRSRRGGLIVALLLIAAAAAVVGVLVARHDKPRVSVYPGPTTLAASRTTTITLRGDDVNVEGAKVTGVKRAEYPGRWTEQRDGHGVTFTPSQPFLPRDRVTVETDDVRSSFLVVGQGEIPRSHFDQGKPEADEGVQHFASRPDLRPPEVAVRSPRRRRVTATSSSVPSAGRRSRAR